MSRSSPKPTVATEVSATPERLSFPEEEARFEWLPMLLDAYHTIDGGVASAIDRAQAKGRTLACARGCSSCCRTHTTIPIYPIEIIGIYWYATEKLEQGKRARLLNQLKSHQDYDACPFLLDDACSIHPMRPMACRQFNVFDQACADGEDAFYTRHQDVMIPIRKYVDEAFFLMLPFYGVKEKLKRRKMIKQGEVHGVVRVMREVEWHKLAERMEEYDANHAAVLKPTQT